MKAIVLADRTHQSLENWRPWQQIPLLRVGEISLIEHSIQSLARAGVRQIDVALGPDSTVIETALGNGARWGVDLTYFCSTGDENPEELLLRMGTLSERTLVVRGDVYRDDVVSEFLEAVNRSDEKEVCATSGRGSLLMACLSDTKYANDFLSMAAADREPPAQLAISFAHAALIEIRSSEQFMRANAQALIAGLQSGRLKPMETKPGLFADVDALVHDSVESAGLAYVGRRSRICADVKLDQTVVLGDRVVVGRGATLSNVIVLNDTFVPGRASVRNTILGVASGCEQLVDLKQSYREIEVPDLPFSNRHRARELLNRRPG